MEYLDLTALRCPEPLIQLKLWLREAEQGQTLTILLADAGSVRDIPIYLQRLGHRIRLKPLAHHTLSLQLEVCAHDCAT